MKMYRLLLLLIVPVAWGQVWQGELRLRIVGPSGATLHAAAELICSGDGYDKTYESDEQGVIAAYELPYGVYQVRVRQPGFAAFSQEIEVRSALPLNETIRLSLPAVTTQVRVTADTLIDPESPSSVMRIGAQEIEQRVGSLPGRSVQDLVDSQPGWLYEGDAVLHPRGSEYQTQFVVDGIPLTDNRSPGFGPELEADDLDSVSLYTAGYPAEYGRKMGGVVALNTRRETAAGLHGQLVLSGGSYDTAAGYGQMQEVAGKSTVSLSGAGSRTSHYLNPVVPENYTNTGTLGDFAGRYAVELGKSDRLSFNLRHEFARFLIPNETLQQQAGQVQNGDTVETMGTVNYQRVMSPEGVMTLAGMVRDNANDLESNQHPTPIAAFQHNSFREGYFKGTYSLHHGRQEFKAGVESDAAFLHEGFHYTITDATQFDSDTPPTLSFRAQKPDLEQAAFAEDLIQLRGWTISAGLRWDHYQLLLNESAWSPRVSIGRSVPSLKMVLHASYDRIFQTPSFENILISSSSPIDALSSEFLQKPVQPSRGDFYEGGLTQSLFSRMRLHANVYRRDVLNYADDDQLLNSGVSYPIAFDKAVIYGAEGKLEVVHLQRLTGYVSYSYMVGAAWLPVTGGLFLGDDASSAASQLSGHFPDSQDQRNTLRTRFRYQLARRVWVASGVSYGSGLPFEYRGDEGVALAEYGPQVIARINFARGRIRPQMSVTSSVGLNLYQAGKMNMDLQADGENLNNRLNVIDFGGLFSGNAIGPARSVAVRLNAKF